MQWPFTIGSIFGIDEYRHFTFLRILGVIGLSVWMQTRELAAALAGVGLVDACLRVCCSTCSVARLRRASSASKRALPRQEHFHRGALSHNGQCLVGALS